MPKCTNKTCCRPLNFLFYGSTSLSGVLFLDEMPEFSRGSLEILRQPLEEKKIRLSRASGTYTFPADFLLLAAMNPCPCGHYPDVERCSCTRQEIERYTKKISHSLLERMDLCVETMPVKFQEAAAGRKEETSREIRKRVERVHQIQSERYKDRNIRFNGELSAADISRYCSLSAEGRILMEQAYERLLETEQITTGWKGVNVHEL